jgi:tRNA nucleotidyltransferase/poly(A) polymerase
MRAGLETRLNSLNKTKFTENDFMGIENFYGADFDARGITISFKAGSEIIKFRYDLRSKKVFFVFNSPNFNISAKYSAVLKKLQASADKVGFELYIMGGFTRDTLLGTEANDLDMRAISANGDINRDLGDFYEQLKKDHPDLKYLKANKYDDKIKDFGFFIDGIEVAFGNFEGFDKEMDTPINALFYNLKTKDLIDTSNKGFSDLLNGKMSIPDNKKDRYSVKTLTNVDAFTIHNLVRPIRISFHTGLELPDEIKNILADKKLVKKAVKKYIKLLSSEPLDKPYGSHQRNINLLFSILRVEDTANVLKYLHENGLLSAILPAIKNVSKKNMNYMLNNISQAGTKNEKFAALLTAFDRKTALNVLNNFPKIMLGVIDEPIFSDNDIKEIMQKYDDIQNKAEISGDPSKIMGSLEKLSASGKHLIASDSRRDGSSERLNPEFGRSLAYAKKQSLSTDVTVDVHTLDKHTKPSAIPNNSLYAGILCAS